MINDVKTALVTGGAKRVGKAIVEDLAAHGWSVAIHCNTSRDAANALAEDIAARCGKATIVQGDLNDSAAVRSLVPDAVEQLGSLSLLVNNASIFEEDVLEDFNDDVWDRHFNVHVKAPSVLSAAFAGQTKDVENLSIVNIIDQRVLKPNPNFYSYSLSKSALWMATRTMALSLAPHVRVNAIGPGPTLPSSRQTQKIFNNQLGSLPLQRGPELPEFGRTIRYLAEARSVTGQMICLDGGQHLAWETDDLKVRE